MSLNTLTDNADGMKIYKNKRLTNHTVDTWSLTQFTTLMTTLILLNSFNCCVTLDTKSLSFLQPFHVLYFVLSGHSSPVSPVSYVFY